VECCGFPHIRTHSTRRKPVIIAPYKQKETYMVDLVMVVQKKDTIASWFHFGWVSIGKYIPAHAILRMFHSRLSGERTCFLFRQPGLSRVRVLTTAFCAFSRQKQVRVIVVIDAGNCTRKVGCKTDSLAPITPKYSVMPARHVRQAPAHSNMWPQARVTSQVCPSNSSLPACCMEDCFLLQTCLRTSCYDDDHWVEPTRMPGYSQMQL
jgi:hypothetical protein